MRRFLRSRMAEWVRRRQGADTLPLVLQRRRLYILPTRAGAGFALLLVLMLLAGFNYSNSVALLLTFWLIGFVLVAMHQCHRNLLGTRLSAAVIEPAFARTEGRLELTFDNPSAQYRLRIAAGLDDGLSTPADLPPLGRNTIELKIPAPVRGVVRLERLRLVTRHPFGLFRTWTWVHAPLEMLVYPRPTGALPMPADDGSKAGRRSTAAIGSDEWLGLRPFRDGDSPRQVDWKAYAREAPLLVKEYNSSSAEMRLFDFAALGSLSTEAKLEQLARWVVDAEAGGERYGLVLPQLRIGPDRGPDHRHRCLAALALFDSGSAA